MCFVYGCRSGQKGFRSHLFQAPRLADKPQWVAKIPKREIPFDFSKSKLCYLHFDEGFIIKNNEYIVINGEKVKNPASARWTLKPNAIPTKFTKGQLTTWYNLPKNKIKKTIPKTFTKGQLTTRHNLSKNKIKTTPSKREFTEIYQKISGSGSSESSSKPKRKNDQGVSVIKSSVPETNPVQEDEPSNLEEPEGPSSPEPILDNLDTPGQEDEDPTPVKLSLNSELIQLPSNQWVIQNEELDNCTQMIFHEIVQITDHSNFKGFSLQKSLVVTDSGEIQYFSNGEDVTQIHSFLQTKIDKIEDLNPLLLSFHNIKINFENRQPVKSLSEYYPGDEDADPTFDESELPPDPHAASSHADDSIVETNAAIETASKSNQNNSSQQDSHEAALKKKFKVRDVSVKALRLSLPTKRKSVSLLVKRLPSKVVKEQQIFQPTKKAKIIPRKSGPKCSSLVQGENVDNGPPPAEEKVPKAHSNLKCSLCEEEFIFYRDYAKHTRSAHRAKTLLCELCGVDISVNNYVSHVRSHTPKGERAWQKKEAQDSTYEFECKICGDGKRFRTQRFLNYHCSMTHTVFIKQPIQLEIFKCKHCTKTFMLEQSLEQHERGHFDEAFKVDLLG